MERGIKLTLPSEQVGGSSEKKMTVPHFWRGGTTGSEHDWMEPLNWYNRHVPGWFDEVVIPEATHLSNFHPAIN
ncbi:MAG: hypothetical protein HY842_14445, partial [Bacteroidetes bacterium]|nr:hypothetical protein [Bacteroidota bacterium]